MFSIQLPGFVKAAILACAFAAPSAFAAPVAFNGVLDRNDAVFNRPLTLNMLSGAGTSVAHDVIGFRVTANGRYSFETTSFDAPSTSGELSNDTFLFLYQGSFNAAAPLQNLLGLDDDSGPELLSTLIHALTAGTDYLLVVSSYSNGVFGAYTGRFDTVTGNGQVLVGLNEVPEPGTLALLPLAALGLALARRRRR